MAYIGPDSPPHGSLIYKDKLVQRLFKRLKGLFRAYRDDSTQFWTDPKEEKAMKEWEDELASKMKPALDALGGKDTPEADAFWTTVAVNRLYRMKGEEAIRPEYRHLIERDDE
jgi:hypothetical protein